MKGFVSLVGAGCAAGLITVLGAERLRSCDAVVYDDLISPEILRLAPEGAELIYMGKRAGRPSAKQEEICAILVSLAREGRRVVRLKGGDPYIFGRGGEEMLALHAAGVPCEEIPGVSSAYAVPALAGIPVTHRGVSRGFHVVTAHTRESGGLPEYFDRLASLPGTLVILMGLGKLDKISERLMRSGMSPDTPCAVVSDGSAPKRFCIRGTLSNIAARAAGAVPPAVIVVGETAAFDLGGGALPLSGVKVGLTGTPRLNAKLSAELIRLGAEPFTACEMRLTPLPEASDTPVDAGCLVFTSAAGVELYFERLLNNGLDARALSGVRTAAVGRATARALNQRGLAADIVPAEQTTSALAVELLSRLEPGCRVVLYRSADGDDALRIRLAERFDVRDIRAYAASPGAAAAGRDTLDAAGYLVFTSAGGVRAAARSLPALPASAVLAAIGAPTADALCALGLPNEIIVSPSPDAAALAEAIAAHRENNKGHG